MEQERATDRLTRKGRRLVANQVLLDGLAQPYRRLSGHVLAQQVVLHDLERPHQVLPGQRLAGDHVSEIAADCADQSARAPRRRRVVLAARNRPGRFVRLGFGENGVDLVVEVADEELPFGRAAAHLVRLHVRHVDGRGRVSLAVGVDARGGIVEDRVWIVLVCDVPVAAPRPLGLGRRTLLRRRRLVAG